MNPKRFTQKTVPLTILLTLLGSLLLPIGANGAPGKHAAGPQPEPPTIPAELNDLIVRIQELPGNILNRGQRNSLVKKLENARAAAQRGRACAAVNILGAFLNETQALRKGARAMIAEELYDSGRAVEDSFFDVFVEASDPCYDPARGQEPEVDVVTSDNTQFAARVSFGAPRMWSVEAGGETWTQLELPAIQGLTGENGQPSIPTWYALIAVPEGAEVSLLLPAVQKVREHVLLNLYPAQPAPADQEPGGQFPSIDPAFANQPFVKDAKAYATNMMFPESPCTITPAGQYRDIQMAQIACAAGQYNPVTDELILFDSLEFEVHFEGGDGNFITSQTLSPFEPASVDGVGAVLNSSAVVQFVRPVDISIRPCFGEELLIVTDPAFRAAADDLAQWKRDKGISTTVIDVGAGTSYPTADDIDDLIEHRYDVCAVRPSYVLIMGDAEFVPPARTDYDTAGDYCSNCGDETTGSDYGYSIYPQWLFDVLFPDFAVARISVDTAAEAQRVVDKIIAYESSPPFVDFASGAPFYTTAALASQFQCCRMNGDGTPLNGQSGTTQRSFVETVEIARSALAAAGKSAERIYMETVDNGGYCIASNPDGSCAQIQAPYNGNTTPNRKYNGTLLPPSLRSGSGFPWNGSTQDIIDAFNDGRFLVVHRDHGGSSGFSNPSFSTGNFGSLTNGNLLPVVYSVNCASGYFDRETNTGGSTESFMEQLLLLNGGGMVGGLGDVRNSPTWANSALLRGFIDATWPNTAPFFGSSTPIRRLGDILNHGKMYLLSQVGVAQTAGSVSFEAAVAELIMWHAYGDPTLEMWTSNPHNIFLPLQFTLLTEPDHMVVNYAANGAEITALQVTKEGLVPVGRAIVEKGVAVIPYFHPPEPGIPVLLSASMPNAVSVLLTPHEQPAVEVDSYPESSATATLTSPDGFVQQIVLRGSSTMNVYFEGPDEGDANDDDGDGLDEVPIEIVALDLRGSSQIGDVAIRLQGDRPSPGLMTERENRILGTLDVPPFAPEGSTFNMADLSLEVEVGVVLHNDEPLRLSGTLTHKPAAACETYESAAPVALNDVQGQPSGFSLALTYTPNACIVN